MTDYKVEFIPISDLKPYPENTKIHTPKQIKQIAESIRQFGFRQNIVVDKDGVIVIGHGRFEAAKSLGLDSVPCVRVEDLTDEQIKALRIIDNKTNESEWDFDSLKSELESLDGLFDFDFDDFGISLDDVTDVIIDKEEKHEKSKERTDFQDANFINTGYAIYDGEGEYEIPPILPTYDLPPIKEWIGFNYVLTDKDPTGKAVHFFLDDYQFERLWSNPTKYIDKLRQYVCVCSPDFSPMPHMPYATQIFNHYRKHWIGRFLQENGVTVIPTIRAASDERSFNYCYDGEPHNSIVVYSAQWTQAKENREISQKEYDEMVSRLEPSKIFVYQAGKKQWLDFRGQNIELIESFKMKHWR